MTGIQREYLQSICILLVFLVPPVIFHISRKYIQATGERAEACIATLLQQAQSLCSYSLLPLPNAFFYAPTVKTHRNTLKYFYYRSVSSFVWMKYTTKKVKTHPSFRKTTGQLESQPKAVTQKPLNYSSAMINGERGPGDSTQLKWREQLDSLRHLSLFM